jgi:hypothetical protein
MDLLSNLFMKWRLFSESRKGSGTLPICIRDDGFVFRPVKRGLPAFAKWTEIREIFAFTLDTLVIDDLICVGIRFDDTGQFIKVDELHPDFQQLMVALARQLAIVPPCPETMRQSPVNGKVSLYGNAIQQDYHPIV